MTGQTSINVSPAQTTTYTLTATNSYGTATSTATVTVTSPPGTVRPLRDLNISGNSCGMGDYNFGYSFTPSVSGQITQLAIMPCDSIAHSVFLYSSGGTVLTTTTITGLNSGNWVVGNITPVNVTAGSTYVVSVRGGSGIYSYQSKNFPQTSGTVTLNQSLYAQATNAMPATPIAGSIYGEADVTFSPGGGGSAPTISTFTSSPSSITQGQTSALSWTTSGATSLFIDNGVGNVTGLTTTNVTPNATTTYTLSAVNSSGTTTRQTTVAVTPLPPTISAFTASPSPINQGQTSALSWTTSGATSLSIDNGVGSVTGLTTTNVTPAQTTTYTLTATNAGGSTTRQVTVTINTVLGISVSPSTQSIALNGNTSYTVTVTKNSGSSVASANVSSSFTCPTGTICTFSNGGVATFGGGTSAAVTYSIFSSGTSPVNTYTIPFAAQGNSCSGTCNPSTSATLKLDSRSGRFGYGAVQLLG